VKRSAEDIKRDLIHVMNQCRSFNLAMNLKRFYLQNPGLRGAKITLR
jgi:hypothetical protein